MRQVRALSWLVLSRSAFCNTEMVQAVYFCFKAKPANSKLAAKQRYCHSLQRNYQKKLKRLKTFPRFQWWMMKTNILRRVLLSWGFGNFWYRDWNRYHQKTIDDFINQQKIANTKKKTATDTDTNTFLFGAGAKNFIVPNVTTTFGLNT